MGQGGGKKGKKHTTAVISHRETDDRQAGGWMAVVLTVKFQQKALAITLAGQPLKSQQTGGRPGTGGRHCRSLVELGTRPCRLPDMCYCEEEEKASQSGSLESGCPAARPDWRQTGPLAADTGRSAHCGGEATNSSTDSKRRWEAGLWCRGAG